jgi:hypothetical protein
MRKIFSFDLKFRLASTQASQTKQEKHKQPARNYTLKKDKIEQAAEAFEF